MTAVASLHHLHSHHHRRLYYATLNRRILANNQSDNNNNNSRLSRSIVTSSIPPSADVFIERPEIIVLTESTALYTNSWDKVCKQYFTNCGMHYAHLDIFRQHPQQRQRLLSSRISKKEKKNDTRGDDNVLHAPVMSLENLEMTLTYDLSRLGTETSPDEHCFNNLDDSSSGQTTSAHVVLIARGPIQCLVAQYFLESSPLAGLVLIDPLLLPEEDGRRKSTTSSSESRWTTSLMELISIIEHVNPPPKDNEEIAFLHSLLQQQQQQQASSSSSSRPLQLEAGAVPMLILYSDNNDTTEYRDTFRICAERTGAYHTFNADHYDHQVVPVIKIPKKENDDNDDDLQSTMRLIYEWYDELVA